MDIEGLTCGRTRPGLKLETLHPCLIKRILRSPTRLGEVGEKEGHRRPGSRKRQVRAEMIPASSRTIPSFGRRKGMDRRQIAPHRGVPGLVPGTHHETDTGVTATLEVVARSIHEVESHPCAPSGESGTVGPRRERGTRVSIRRRNEGSRPLGRPTRRIVVGVPVPIPTLVQHDLAVPILQIVDKQEPGCGRGSDGRCRGCRRGPGWCRNGGTRIGPTVHMKGYRPGVARPDRHSGFYDSGWVISRIVETGHRDIQMEVDPLPNRKSHG